MTRVVNLRRESFDAKIDRTTPYGNPFRIGQHGTRTEVIAAYERWVRAPKRRELRNRMRRELRGKVIACWCSPAECHGDVIARIAEEEMEP